MRMKRGPWVVGLMALCLVVSLLLLNGGCHYVYPIEGHRGANRDNPPDITMAVGEERVAVRANLGLRTAVRWKIALRICVPSMNSSDASIVEVTRPDKDTVILRAKSPGRALLKYHPCPAEPNRGFWVTVEDPPANQPEAGDGTR